MHFLKEHDIPIAMNFVIVTKNSHFFRFFSVVIVYICHEYLLMNIFFF